MDETVDVLVVGAGPTGLTLAVNLLRAGLRVRLVDSAPERSPHSRALAVQARTLELFDKLGMARPLIERGHRTPNVSFHVKGKRVAHLEIPDLGVDDSPFPFVLLVSQVETERVLERELLRLEGRVERPLRLVSLEQSGELVTATLEHAGRPQTVRAKYLVGCDGAHSEVRHSLGLEFEGGDYPRTFLLGDVEVDWELPTDELHLFLGQEGLFAAFPLGGRRIRVVVSTTGSTRDGEDDPTVEELRGIARDVCRCELSFRDPQWLSRFRVHHRCVKRYSMGRVFLAGDAAHIHSPAGGQGMNTGIQDAWNLGWKLALALRGEATPALLESYQLERHPVGLKLLRFTDRLFSAATSRNPLIVAARQSLMPRVAKFLVNRRKLRARLFRFVSELGIRYRESPIVGWAEGAPHRDVCPAPGDRAPDAKIGLPVGEDASLFAALGGVDHHLLVFDYQGRFVGSPSLRLGIPTRVHQIGAEPRAGFLHDREGAVRERYGVDQAALFLIRPDGHVAFRAEALDFEGLRRHVAHTYRA